MPKFPDPGFDTRPLRIDLEGMHFALEVVARPETLLDDLLAKGEGHEDVRDERIPYWAELWPSAAALGRYLISQGEPLAGKAVTEIGCGLGLAGIVAGALGARVTFTDYLEDALGMARRNWAHNLRAPARFERMDWRAPRPELAADILLASDVAYEARFFPDLPRAFRALLRPGGKVLLSEPNRAMAEPFIQSLPEQGFRVTPTRWEGMLEGLPYRVNVFEILPK